MYYKVVNDRLRSIFVSDSNAIQYKAGEWVSAPSIDKPLFVFSSLESAKRFHRAYGGYIYTCEIDGQLANQSVVYSPPDNSVFACKVRLVTKITQSHVMQNGDIVRFTGDWYGDIGIWQDGYIVCIIDSEQSVGKKLDYTDCTTIEDCSRSTAEEFGNVGCEIVKGEFSFEEGE